MFINKIEELNSCVQNGYPCDLLRGSLSLTPIYASCLQGNESGRGVCRFYCKGKLSVDETIKRETGTYEYIVVQDEEGYYRLLQYNNTDQMYSNVVDKVKMFDKEMAKVIFKKMHHITDEQMY